MDIDMELIGRLLPDASDSRSAATRMALLWPGAPPLALAERATIAAQRRAMAAGLGTGLVSHPALMLPFAMIDMALMIRTEAHLAGVIAALLDPPSLDDEGRRQMDIYVMLFPDLLVELEALRAAGPTQTPADPPAPTAGVMDHRTRLRRRFGKGVGSALLKLIGKYIGLRLTQRSVLWRAMPLVGGAVGATLNWSAVRSVGERAMTYHLWRRRGLAPDGPSWAVTSPSPVPHLA